MYFRLSVSATVNNIVHGIWAIFWATWLLFKVKDILFYIFMKVELFESQIRTTQVTTEPLELVWIYWGAS